MRAGECSVCGRDRVAIMDGTAICILCFRLHYEEIAPSDLKIIANLVEIMAKKRIKEITGKRPYRMFQ